jgi:rhomboid protease GluP
MAGGQWAAEAAACLWTRARQGSAHAPPRPPKAPARPAPPGRLRRHWLVLGLAALCLLAELLLLGAERGLWGSTRWRLLAYLNGGFWAGLVRAGWEGNYALQPITMFLSHPLLHAGFSHLATNVIALVALGAMVRNRAGRRGWRWCWRPRFWAGARPSPPSGRWASRWSASRAGCSGWRGAPGVAGAGPPGARALAVGRARAGRGADGAEPALGLAVGWQMAWEAHLGGFLGRRAGRRGARPAGAAASRPA